MQVFLYRCFRGPSPADLADVDYRLLELFARSSSSSGGGAKTGDGAFLAQLLAPEALTPDRLDALPAWLLLQALQAIGALPDQAGAASAALQVGTPYIPCRSVLPHQQLPVACNSVPSCLKMSFR